MPNTVGPGGPKIALRRRSTRFSEPKKQAS
jgi:hypothetical protein